MNKTNEAVAATGLGVGAVAWSWVDQAHQIMQILVTLAGLAWWIRLWLSDPGLKPPGSDDRMKCEPMVVLFAVLMVLVTAGCAYHRPQLRSEERATNGVVRVVETSSPGWALWPATQDLTRERLSNGKTQSIGVEGLTQDGGGTNVADTIRALSGLLERLRP
jgi:hypothetical protein